MVSAVRIRQTVLGLIDLPKVTAARAATSVVDWRLQGRRVSCTSSHAIALTRTWSRGGKPGFAPPARLILQAPHLLRPAAPPIPDGMGVQAALCRCLDIGEEGGGMQE